MNFINVHDAVECLNKGQIIAYPTEAIYGLGCLPENTASLDVLLQLKQRDKNKGLILIASSIDQLLPYLDLTCIPTDRWEHIQRTWPGPFTWIFPATKRVLPQVRGQFSTVAVRVTAHPVASALAHHLGGALISTSANLSTHTPCKDAKEILQQFGEDIAGVVEGSLGLNANPTSIQDALTGTIYR